MKLPKLALVSLIILLVSGCSQKVEVDGVECIQTMDIFATDLECNWDAYNAKENKGPWLPRN